MISVSLGGIGNGKTTWQTFLSLLKFVNGYTVYTNRFLEIPTHPLGTIEDVIELLDDIGESTNHKYRQFDMDEGWIEADARLSSSLKNIAWSRFMMQTRKVGFDVDITAQHKGQLDKRIRDAVDLIYKPTVLFWEGEPRRSKPLLMQIRCFKRDTDTGAFVLFNTVYLKTPDEFLNLFNTFEVIGQAETKKLLQKANMSLVQQTGDMSQDKEINRDFEPLFKKEFLDEIEI